MEIEIIAFGKIAEFIAHQRLMFHDVRDTDALKKALEISYPALTSLKYKIALNKNIVQQNMPLHTNDSVALMPPFSGG